MSNSNDIKNELLSRPLRSSCCRLAEMCSYIALLGNITLSKSEISLSFNTENEGLAKRIFSFSVKLLDSKPYMDMLKNPIHSNNIFRIVLANVYAQKILSLCYNYTGSPFFTRIPNKNVLANTCCKQSFMRSAFLSAGTVVNPEKSYHLEIVAGNEEFAHSLKNVINFFELNAKITGRKNSYVVYLKEADKLSQFLSLTGAHNSLLNLENIRILKEIRNNVNRQLNCDTANTEKTVRAAILQSDNINYLIETNMFASLPDTLKTACELRLEYPSLSLFELSQMDGSVSKSALAHRFRKIDELVSELKNI